MQNFFCKTRAEKFCFTNCRTSTTFPFPTIRRAFQKFFFAAPCSFGFFLSVERRLAQFCVALTPSVGSAGFQPAVVTGILPSFFCVPHVPSVVMVPSLFSFFAGSLTSD